jgi:hypothetical protein
MSPRSMEKIVSLPTEEKREGPEIPKSTEEASITMDFPRPTKLTEILTSIAKWQKYTMIMEPRLDRSVQIFSPSPLTKDEAFKVFLAALQTVGLRAIFMGPNTLKISELAGSKRQA